MDQNLSVSVNALFPPQGARIANVKFFRGSNREVTAEQLIAQFYTAERQVIEGKATRMDDVDGDLEA